MMDKLDECRMKIDALDAQIVELYERRLCVSDEIAAYKREHGMAVYQPERERAVIERAVSRLGSLADADGLRAVFEALMAASRARQARG